MSSPDVSDNEFDDVGPTIEVVYPLNEETEVPQTNAQLFKTVLEEGTGSKPPRNSKVTVSYKGTLASNGTVFDSNDTFEFTIGAGQVIKGWDQGVATMRKGERAMLRCLPEYAYGAGGSPPTIPANATLNFEVQVKDWTKSEDISENRDKTLTKSVVAEGRNYDKAEYESEVTFDVIVFTGDEENKTEVGRKLEWAAVIGETVLPVGLEQALCSMKEGEQSVITVAAKLVVSDDAPLGIRAHTAVFYEVTLHKLHKIKTWTYAGKDKIVEGAKRKDQGNAYFQKADWVAAEKKYRRCLEFVEYDQGLNDEEKVEATKLLTASRTNLAQVLINIHRYNDAIVECNKVLGVDGSNVKALFRRSRAQFLLDEWTEAKQDAQKLLDMDPSNADAANLLAAIQQKIRDFDKSQKAKYGNLFAKLSKMEEKDSKRADDAPPALEQQ